MAEKHSTSIPPTHAVNFATDLRARLKDVAYAREYILACFDEAAEAKDWKLFATAAVDVIAAQTLAVVLDHFHSKLLAEAIMPGGDK
jgi:hypothetical protein